jgi:hypothetical protein
MNDNLDNENYKHDSFYLRAGESDWLSKFAQKFTKKAESSIGPSPPPPNNSPLMDAGIRQQYATQIANEVMRGTIGSVNIGSVNDFLKNHDLVANSDYNHVDVIDIVDQLSKRNIQPNTIQQNNIYDFASQEADEIISSMIDSKRLLPENAIRIIINGSIADAASKGIIPANEQGNYFKKTLEKYIEITQSYDAIANELHQFKINYHPQQTEIDNWVKQKTGDVNSHIGKYVILKANSLGIGVNTDKNNKRFEEIILSVGKSIEQIDNILKKGFIDELNKNKNNHILKTYIPDPMNAIAQIQSFHDFIQKGDNFLVKLDNSFVSAKNEKQIKTAGIFSWLFGNKKNEEEIQNLIIDIKREMLIINSTINYMYNNKTAFIQEMQSKQGVNNQQNTILNQFDQFLTQLHTQSNNVCKSLGIEPIQNVSNPQVIENAKQAMSAGDQAVSPQTGQAVNAQPYQLIPAQGTAGGQVSAVPPQMIVGMGNGQVPDVKAMTLDQMFDQIAILLGSWTDEGRKLSDKIRLIQIDFRKIMNGETINSSTQQIQTNQQTNPSQTNPSYETQLDIEEIDI